MAAVECARGHMFRLKKIDMLANSLAKGDSEKILTGEDSGTTDSTVKASTNGEPETHTSAFGWLARSTVRVSRSSDQALSTRVTGEMTRWKASVSTL